MEIRAKIDKTIKSKHSNLIVAADTNSAEELVAIATNIGSNICMLKTHIDMIDDFSPKLIGKLKQIAKQENFLLFEDRKFADIGQTTLHQYTEGIFKIADWADVVTVHALPGPGILQAIEPTCVQRKSGVLLLLQMSSNGNLLSDSYRQMALNIGKKYQHIVPGVIAQKKLNDEPNWLTCTPGVKINDAGDKLGQQYNTPENVILKNNSDIIIVGRGITRATNPKQEAEKYQRLAWQSYIKKTSM